MCLNMDHVIFLSAGMVSKPQGQVEEEGEVLGSQQRDGGVRPVRSHGPSLNPAA